ncbi:MAG: hypothetical protein IT158_08275 [Bryobacterales bacterium]|nr:hypothetical protein [Bryobacterales bacterium]
MAKTDTAVLVGSDSLLGREIRELFSSAGLPARLELAAGSEEEAGSLTEQDEEPALVRQLDRDALESARVVFLAGTREAGREALAAGSEAAVIDLTYASEDNPAARLRAPSLEPPGYQVPRGAVHVIAHPAAVSIALLLGRLHAAYPLRRAVVHVFEPASERGRKGIDELQQQTVNLFAFKSMPRAVFDAQLTFNLLARLGEEAPENLEEVEQRIERHVATLHSISSHAPMPSLRLIQAPVFHGYSLSFWVEFERNPGIEALERVLSPSPVDLRGKGVEPPNIVGVAGQSGVAVGALAADRNDAQACWFWAAVDNIRLSSEEALAVARQLL